MEELTGYIKTTITFMKMLKLLILIYLQATL